MSVKSKIGLRIKELRRQKGLSQEALAHIAELDRTYINSVENGKRNISILNIEKIANALEVSLKKFFNHADFENNDDNSRSR
jgi:transcriptional regulator with XRE-family HTH domain